MGYCLTEIKLSQGVSEAKHHCLVENNNSQMNLFVWDPTEPIATRPLFMLSNPGSYKFFYTFDGNKNVSELVHFESRNGIAAHYDYAPFGAVTRAVNTSAISARNFHLENSFRFSSEYHDDTLGLVYYNYRHYNPTDGRWCSRDCFNEQLLLDYVMCSNCTTSLIDLLGNTEFSFSFSRDLPTCPFGASGFFFESALEFNGEFKECFLCNKENQPEIHFFVKSKISLSAAIRYGLSYDDGIDQKGKFVYQKEGYNRYRNLKGQFASKPTTGFFKELLGLHLEEWDVVPASRENWKSLPLCPQDSATGAIDGFVNGKASVLGFGSEFNLVWRIFPNGSFTPRFDYSRGFVGGGTSLYIRAGVLGSVTFTTTY